MYQQAQDRLEALHEGGMPTIALPHMPPPLCTGLMPTNDSEHNGQLFSPGAPTQVLSPSPLHFHKRISSESQEVRAATMEFWWCRSASP